MENEVTSTASELSNQLMSSVGATVNTGDVMIVIDNKVWRGKMLTKLMEFASSTGFLNITVHKRLYKLFHLSFYIWG